MTGLGLSTMSRVGLLMAALLTVNIGSAGRASAQTVTGPETPAVARPAPIVPLSSPTALPEQPSWYGWQVWAADAAVLAVTAACLSKAGNDDCVWMLPGYLLGGPIVHGLHKGSTRFFGSLVLRAAGPLVGALLGGALVDCSDTYDNYCGAGGIVLGLAVGTAAAIFIDGVVAFEDGTPSPRPARAPSVTPTVSVGGGNTVLGLVGRF